MSPAGSTVKTDEKNVPNTSAFSLSEVVSLDLSSFGFIFNAATPSLVFVLPLMYFQIAFGFDLASAARFDSNCFWAFLGRIRHGHGNGIGRFTNSDRKDIEELVSELRNGGYLGFAVPYSGIGYAYGYAMAMADHVNIKAHPKLNPNPKP